MKVLIPAAGRGSRLQHFTVEKPKTMLEIRGFPIIYHLIHGLLHHRIDDICIVTGYRQQLLINYIMEAFPGQKFSFIYNPYFSEMNNIYSYYLAAPYLTDDNLLIVNSDVFCEPALLGTAIYAPPNSMVIDSEKAYSTEGTKVIMDGGGRIITISKDVSAVRYQGEYIGMVKLSAHAGKLLYARVKELLYLGETGTWFVYALNDLLPGLAMHPVYTGGRVWEEIDDPDDYRHALQLAEKIPPVMNK